MTLARSLTNYPDWLAHVLKSCLEKKLILMPFMMWIKITVCWWKWLVFHFRLNVSSRCAITSTALDFKLTFSTVSIIIMELHGHAKPHSYINLPILENLVIMWWYTAWATDRPSPPQAQQYKITQSTGLATLACTTGALWAKRGKRDISRGARHLREARDEGKRKIKRLFAVHCSCCSTNARPSIR